MLVGARVGVKSSKAPTLLCSRPRRMIRVPATLHAASAVKDRLHAVERSSGAAVERMYGPNVAIPVQHEAERTGGPHVSSSSALRGPRIAPTVSAVVRGHVSGGARHVG